jgi:hypothetical protein
MPLNDVLHKNNEINLIIKDKRPKKQGVQTEKRRVAPGW